ncbi:hypothetical protein NDU88_004282 [Pleurodeles waltl]|uniref:Uncharacterized protein n=1 Tax=Pleurodeles waltl TaxID=8319 RepID=A0AAV7VGM3_PLEWA|nr:hypothetical protein NDU88_004282 [Pleurodeles waltl]
MKTQTGVRVDNKMFRHVKGVAVKPMEMCFVQCPRVHRQNVWIQCMTQNSAAPSAKRSAVAGAIKMIRILQVGQAY